MARERLPPDDPREWLNRARSNLALAGKMAPDVYLEDLCFDAQQAAEKAIEAFAARETVILRLVPRPTCRKASGGVLDWGGAREGLDQTTR